MILDRVGCVLVPPLAQRCRRDVDTAEVRSPDVVRARELIAENRVTSAGQRVGQQNLRRETDRSDPRASPSEIPVAQALIELGPVRKGAVLHVDGSVDGGKRRQHDRKDDQCRHRHQPALPKVPARIPGQLDVGAARAGNRHGVVGPQQERQREHEEQERVAVLVRRSVEQVGCKRGCTRDEAEERASPAQNAPAEPGPCDPHEPADDIEVEAGLVCRGSIGDPSPPPDDHAEAHRVRRNQGVERGAGRDAGDNRTQDEACAKRRRPGNRKHGQHAQQERAAQPDDGHDVDARDPPAGRRRRTRDGVGQQEDKDRRPDDGASHGRAGAAPYDSREVLQPARRYELHHVSSRAVRSRLPCGRRRGRRPGRGQSLGSGPARRSCPCRDRKRSGSCGGLEPPA